jgi:hypothetical protein
MDIIPFIMRPRPEAKIVILKERVKILEELCKLKDERIMILEALIKGLIHEKKED